MAKFYGQAEQDKFVLNALKFKKNGLFLDIGACDPIQYNRTYALETFYGWKGIIVDSHESYLEKYQQERKNSIYLIEEPYNVDYTALLREKNIPLTIDYLQMNLTERDGSALYTIQNLQKSLFTTHKFAVVTFKHDVYAGNIFNTRDESRFIFEKAGYYCVFPDVQHNDDPKWVYEDWYVHPELVDMTEVQKLQKMNQNNYIENDLTQSKSIYWKRIEYNLPEKSPEKSSEKDTRIPVVNINKTLDPSIDKTNIMMDMMEKKMDYKTLNIQNTTSEFRQKVEDALKEIEDPPLVSCIIPSYNRFKYLMNAIDSIMNQTYKNVEIIVVDDASTEEKYNKFDFSIFGGNLKIIHNEENSRKKLRIPSPGAYSRNIALQHANGKYIAFLDDDDIWLPDKLQIQIAIMEKERLDMTATQVYLGNGVYNHHRKYRMGNDEIFLGTIKGYFRNCKSNLFDNGMPDMITLEHQKIHNILITSSVVMTKELIAKTGEFNVSKRNEDYDYWNRALEYTPFCYYIKRPLIYYDNSHGDGRLY